MEMGGTGVEVVEMREVEHNPTDMEINGRNIVQTRVVVPGEANKALKLTWIMVKKDPF